MMPQLGTSLTDDSKSVIYDCNMFIKQARDVHPGGQPKPLSTINEASLVCLRISANNDLYTNDYRIDYRYHTQHNDIQPNDTQHNI